PDALIDALSQIPALRVIALSSTLRYKAHPADAKQVGVDLGVRAVVTGHLRQQGPDLAIVIEVVDTHDDRRIWGHRYARTVANIVGAQGDLARDVADTLRGRLSEAEGERLSRPPTQNSDAYRLYLQGRSFWNRYSEDGFKTAIEYFRRAIARDPEYALAYAGLADAEMQLGVDFLNPGETFPQGKQYAERALALDPALGEAHASLGIYAMWFDRDWAAAEREYRQAIDLRPNYPVAHHFYAHYLDARGRTDESIAEIMRALDLDPLSPYVMEEVGWTYYHARRYDQAIAWNKRALDLDPHFDLGWFTLAQVYVAQGAYTDAAKALDQASGLAGWYGTDAERAVIEALTGRSADARQILISLLARASSSYVDPFYIAITYTSLGDREHAFEWLDKCIDGRSVYATFFTREATLDRLRSDSRFAALVARVGLN
ncbi:MAG TPA: tetratricopeptide repeat protein, partial [Vicinamibacterales bacterium]|nr:tetratricopeptide repeat protein [Vicinamibacterales bacterium]